MSASQSRPVQPQSGIDTHTVPFHAKRAWGDGQVGGVACASIAAQDRWDVTPANVAQAPATQIGVRHSKSVGDVQASSMGAASIGQSAFLEHEGAAHAGASTMHAPIPSQCAEGSGFGVGHPSSAQSGRQLFPAGAPTHTPEGTQFPGNEPHCPAAHKATSLPAQPSQNTQAALPPGQS
jgi:hypothetical protein